MKISRRRALVGAGLLVLLILIGARLFYGYKARSFDLDSLVEMPQRTEVMDRNGQFIGHVYGHGKNRKVVDVDEVSEHFINALLAREDTRFYRHGGIDWRGVARAAVKNLRSGNIEEGASTLTMQLARQTYGLLGESYHRKFVEAALASRIERKFDKDEILAHYMNRIYFGSGLYGIERAAQGYFMKPASELTLAESAMLAGLIRAPSALTPFHHLEEAKAVRDEVLERMLKLKEITPEEAEAARNQPLVLRPPDQRMAEPDWIIQAVHRELARFLDAERIRKGGLRIHTTIDHNLQEQASRILESRLSKVEQQSGFPHPAKNSAPSTEGQAFTSYVQGSVVALDNQTGGILALVGGRDFHDSPFDRAMHSQRQVGSTFKPFVYATGFEQGLKPGMYESDGPISMPAGNGRAWTPQNSDGGNLGTQPAAIGLIRSRNTMTIRFGMRAGVGNVLETAREAGFGADIPESPVAFLGAFETDPLTLASAYSVFPNHGQRRRPFLIRRIETLDGELVHESQSLQYRVLQEGAAWMTTEILGEVINRGTAASARRLGFEQTAYGKTGTTDDYRDAWFAGFTDKVTCAVWVGMDRPQTIMHRGYGSTLALPVWVDLMQYAEQNGYASQPLRPPAPLTSVVLCRQCGKLASRFTGQSYQAPLPPDMVPEDYCQGHGIASAPQRPRDRGEGFLRKLGRMLFR